MATFLIFKNSKRSTPPWQKRRRLRPLQSLLDHFKTIYLFSIILYGITKLGLASNDQKLASIHRFMSQQLSRTAATPTHPPTPEAPFLPLE